MKFLLKKSKRTLRTLIAPSKFHVGVKKIRHLNKGEVAIECNTNEALERVIKEINDNPKTKTTMETRS